MAKAGKRIAVTDRGKLVAYLVPAEEPTTSFERLVAAGQVRRATGKHSRITCRPHRPTREPAR